MARPPSKTASKLPISGSAPDDQLLNLDAKGKAPRTRIRDSKSLHAIYTALKEADSASSLNRSMVDAMFDGEPPYDDADLAAAGQSQTTNLDFGEGAAALEASLTGYYDLTNSVDVLARLHTSYGDDGGADPDARAEWEQVLSEEHTRMMRGWAEFESLFQRLCTEFVKHGVGLAYHPTDDNWQFDVSGLNGFLIPRTTKASEDHIDVAVAERTMQLHELYRYIDREDFAAGWTVREVQEALVNATKTDETKNFGRDWEKLQRDLKNNDLGTSYGTSASVALIHSWSREFDGKVTHCISLQSNKNKDFLFRKIGRFPSMHDCFTIFTYGVGNGYYSSIRGLGFKIFPSVQVSNRLRGKAVDGAMFGSSIMVQPESEKATLSLELTYLGPYAVLPTGYKAVPTVLPNVATQVMPVIHDLSLLMQNNAGTYRARQITADGSEETATGVKARVSHEATLSVSALNLFYQPWGRLMTSSVKRLVARKLQRREPGYAEQEEFFKRCIARGVPEAAIKAVDRVEVVRAVGYGSAAMRDMAFGEMLQLAGSLDEVGQNHLLRAKFASKLGGYETANYFVPKLTKSARLPVDADIALLENAAMQGGVPMPVRDGQNHPTHTRIHLPEIEQAAQAMDQLGQQSDGQGGGGIDLQALQEVLSFLHAAVPHTAQHVQTSLSDPLHEAEAKQARKVLQDIDNQMQAATANFKKEMQARQQAAQEQQAPAPPPMDPKLQKMMDQWQVQRQMLVEDHQLKSQLKISETQQRMTLRDAQNAQKMRTAREKNAADAEAPPARAPKAKH